MNKKNIIILICAIILLIIGIAVFLFANNQSKPNSSQKSNTPTSNTNNTDHTESQVNKFTFYDEDSNSFVLEDFSDKPIALLLWKSNEDDLLETIALFENAYEKYESKINLLVINTSEPDMNIIEHTKQANFDIPIYFDIDNTANLEFSFEELPYLVFIDKDGTIQMQKQGTMSEDAFLANLDLISHNY